MFKYLFPAEVADNDVELEQLVPNQPIAKEEVTHDLDDLSHNEERVERIVDSSSNIPMAEKPEEPSLGEVFPQELLLHIINFTTLSAQASLAKTSTQFRDLVNDNLHWKTRFQRHFPQIYKTLNRRDIDRIDYRALFITTRKQQYENLSPIQTKLFEAIKDGDLSTIKALQSLCLEDWLAKDADGNPAYLIAAHNGHQKILDYLFQQAQEAQQTGSSIISTFTSLVMGTLDSHRYLNLLRWACICNQSSAVVDPILMTANVNATIADDMSAILLAAQTGHTELVQKLIDAGADVNAVNSQGYTALMYAAKNGHSACVQKLIAKGALVDVISSNHYSALSLAAQYGHEQCVEIILEELKKKENIDSNQLNSALILSSMNNHTKCVNLLVAAGADVNVTDSRNGKTVLMFAAANGSFDCMELLIAANAKLDTKMPNLMSLDYFHLGSFTALMHAAKNGHANCVQLLMDNNADINITNRDGLTALMLTAQAGHADCLQVFIDAGVDINAVDGKGKTILMFAAESGDADCVQRLIDKGADTQAETTDGKEMTALKIADKNDHSAVVAILLKEGLHAYIASLDSRSSVSRNPARFFPIAPSEDETKEAKAAAEALLTVISDDSSTESLMPHQEILDNPESELGQLYYICYKYYPPRINSALEIPPAMAEGGDNKLNIESEIAGDGSFDEEDVDGKSDAAVNTFAMSLLQHS